MPRCKPTIIKVGDLVKVADWCQNKGLDLLRSGQHGSTDGLDQLAAGNQLPERNLLIAPLTTKRQDRLAALDGQQAADEGLTLNQNADDVVSVEIVRQG